ARPRADTDGVAQQVADALHDRQTEPETATAFARGVVELMKLLEDRGQLARWNADARVPNLDAEIVAAPAAAEQNLAPRGVFHGVRQQIAQCLLDEMGIASDRQPASDDVP